MLGKCSACGTQVIEIKKENGKVKAKYLSNYKEHIIELSNHSIMRVAVCDKCKVELVAGKSKEIAVKIVDNHIDFWGKNKKTAPKEFASLTCVNSNTTLQDFTRKIEKIKQEAELNKQLNLE